MVPSNMIKLASKHQRPFNFVCKKWLQNSPQANIESRSLGRLQKLRSYHNTSITKKEDAKVPIIYIDQMGVEKEVEASVGKNLLDVAHDNDIELEGACGGELACATCHLIFEQEMYDSLPEKVPEEDDMLDLAFELTDTSRLGCQILVREDMTGMKVRIPDDGF